MRVPNGKWFSNRFRRSKVNYAYFYFFGAFMLFVCCLFHPNLQQFLHFTDFLFV